LATQHFGVSEGLRPGLDRDALVEAMTQRTQTRVTEKEADITKLKWKQDAYRNLTDQILDMEDNFLSFSSGSSVKDEDLYEPSIVTAQGNESSTKYVSASGLSDMTAHIAISAVTRPCYICHSCFRSGVVLLHRLKHPFR
jgi:flagellar hook-associated protein 2